MAEIAAVRTVRLLDREPEKPALKPQEKRVGPVLIEKGIPLRPRHQHRPNVIVEALKSMDVGDSFVWRTRVNTEAIRQVPGRKFVQRIVGRGPSYRVWRTA